MRQIKFRARNRRFNRMEEYLEIRMDTLNDLFFNWENKVYMQYTWIKDKDWKDIYEWDILEYYNKNSTWFYKNARWFLWYYFRACRYDVQGRIYASSLVWVTRRGYSFELLEVCQRWRKAQILKRRKRENTKTCKLQEAGFMKNFIW